MSNLLPAVAGDLRNIYDLGGLLSSCRYYSPWSEYVDSVPTFTLLRVRRHFHLAGSGTKH